MKEPTKAIWMRRRDGIEELEDDRLDLLPDEPTRALWNACPNPPPLDMAEANAMFRRALEKSGVKPRWWFMPRPVALTFATCGGVFLAAFLAFGPSNGPSAWVPLIQSLAPSQEMAQIARPQKPVRLAQAQPAPTPPMAKTPSTSAPAPKVDSAPVQRVAVSAPVVTPSVTSVETSKQPAERRSSRKTGPRTTSALPHVAIAVAPPPSQRPYLFVAVTKAEPMLTASITHDNSSRGGYARVTALRPNDNGVLVRTEATVTPSEPDPQVVTHVPSWATGMNGLPAPVSTRSAIVNPTSEGDK